MRGEGNSVVGGKGAGSGDSGENIFVRATLHPNIRLVLSVRLEKKSLRGIGSDARQTGDALSQS